MNKINPMHNRIATTRDNELYIAGYETEEPRIPDPLKVTEQDYIDAVLRFKQWQSSKREYKVRSEDKHEIHLLLLKEAIILDEYEDPDNHLSKGIPCDFLADRLELEDVLETCGILTNGNINKQWTLKPLVVEQERNEAVEFARWLCVNKWKSENGIYYEKGFGFLKEPELKNVDELYTIFKTK